MTIEQLVRARILHLAVVAVAALFLLGLFTWPWFTHLSTHILGYSENTDAFSFAYQMQWWAQCIKTLHSPYGTIPLIGVDCAIPAVCHDQTPVASFIGGLLTLALGPILAYNLLIIVICVCNALAMSALAEYLTKSRLAAVLAGVAFAFSPYVFFRYACHLNLIQIFWLPLTILWAEQYANTGSRGKLLMSAFSSSALFLSSPYYLLLLGPGLFAYFCLRLRTKAVFALVAIWLVLVVPLSVFPNLAMQRGTWPLELFQRGSAHWTDYILREPKMHEHLRLGHRLCPGAIVLLLALLGIRHPSRKQWLPLASFGAICLILSLGPTPLHEIPGFQNIRAPNRAGVGVIFVLITMAAYGCVMLPGKYRAWCVTLSICALIALWPDPRFYISDARPNAAETFLAAGRGTIGVLPDGVAGNGRIIWGTIYHKRRTLAGFGGTMQPQETMRYFDELRRLYPNEDVTFPILQHRGRTILLFLGPNPAAHRANLNAISRWRHWRLRVVSGDWAVLTYGNQPSPAGVGLSSEGLPLDSKSAYRNP